MANAKGSGRRNPKQLEIEKRKDEARAERLARKQSGSKKTAAESGKPAQVRLDR